MTHILLPDDSYRRLAFYLSMEEYLAKETPLSSCFFLWSVKPTVIFGRNQDMQAEVNVDYCEANGVDMIRRKSGGGCVYADEGNLMLSYITRETDVNSVFADYLNGLSEALREMGFNAVATEHNDVLVDGRKVSGNAFYALPQSSIVHGTLLLNEDFTAMEKSITPSKEKLGKHGVQSVRQRVGNLGADMDVVKKHLIEHFCDSEYVLSAEEIKQIEEMEQTYLDENFLKFGRYKK